MSEEELPAVEQNEYWPTREEEFLEDLRFGIILDWMVSVAGENVAKYEDELSNAEKDIASFSDLAEFRQILEIDKRQASTYSQIISNLHHARHQFELLEQRLIDHSDKATRAYKGKRIKIIDNSPQLDTSGKHHSRSARKAAAPIIAEGLISRVNTDAGWISMNKEGGLLPFRTRNQNFHWLVDTVSYDEATEEPDVRIKNHVVVEFID